MSFMLGRLNVFSVSLETCCLTCSDDIFLPNVGPTFSTCLRHVGVCRDDMSFGGSWRRDVTPTFPTKLGCCCLCAMSVGGLLYFMDTWQPVDRLADSQIPIGMVPIAPPIGQFDRCSNQISNRF